ncbi:hypothetical protein OKW28_007272 [Paraburkholderia sp. 40]
MRATTAIPPTNHAHSAARTPDPRSFARHPRPQYPPARASGRHPNGTSLAALRWNAKRGHRHAAPAALRCRFRAVQAVARSSARTGRAAHCTSHRAAGPGRTRHDPRPDTRSDRTRRTGHAADRRSAAAANANASGRRPSVATTAMLIRRSMSAPCRALDGTTSRTARRHALGRCRALLYLLQSRRMFYRQFTVSPPRL